MQINTTVVGKLQCNCYTILKDKEAIIIDPGDDIEKIMLSLQDKKLVGILITHYHFDHVGALRELKRRFDVPIYDYQNLLTKELNHFHFEIIPTKGHTSDSVTYYFKEEKVMFTGDFLFRNTIGRTDLESGNMLKMQESIEKIKKYADDILIYPGHGQMTTLGQEKQNNIWFKGEYYER